MKIEKIIIEDYKILKNLQLDFTDKEGKPLDIIVLAGINGTGKTSILEYLRNHFFKNSNTISHKGSRNIEIFYTDNKHFLFLPKNNKQKQFRQPIKKQSENIIIEFIDYLIYEKKINPDKAYQKINYILQHIFKKFNLKFQFSDRDRNKNIWFTNEQKKKIQLNELSDGEQELIEKGFTLYLSNIKNGLILIDEPDSSLHPIWQKYLLEIYRNFAKENNTQIILATHSPHIVASAEAEEVFLLYSNAETKKIEVSNLVKLSKFSKGRDINSVLSDIFGVSKRDEKYKEKINKLYDYIEDENLEKATKLLRELTKLWGENDREIVRANMYYEDLMD